MRRRLSFVKKIMSAGEDENFFYFLFVIFFDKHLVQKILSGGVVFVASLSDHLMHPLLHRRLSFDIIFFNFVVHELSRNT